MLGGSPSGAGGTETAEGAGGEGELVMQMQEHMLKNHQLDCISRELVLI